MVLELSRSVEFAPTAPTLELAVLVVTTNVVLEVALGNELLVADLTFVVTVAEVALQVDIKVPLLGEFIPTVIALIGLNS